MSSPSSAQRISTPPPASARAPGEREPGSSPAAVPVAAAPAPERSRKRRFAIAAVVAAVGLGAFGYFMSRRGLESTDDAQVDADMVMVPSRAGGTVTYVRFADNQRVEAGTLLVELDDAEAKARLAQAEAEVLAAHASADAARASAELTEKNAFAGKNIASASLTGAAASATATADQNAEIDANLASARALRDKDQSELDRVERLVASGSLASAELERAQADFDAAQAAVDQAEARRVTLKSSTSQARARVSEASARLHQASDTLSAQIAEAKAAADAASARVATAEAERDLAKLALSYTKIFAPSAGVVSRRSVAPGQLVSAGQTVVTIVPDSRHRGRVWVTGNFKETQLTHMRVGQHATLTVDAFGRELHGHVQSFSGATGARFALLPPDNATGNFTKVVQRVPVRIELDDAPSDLMLLPGLSVELTVNTRL